MLGRRLHDSWKRVVLCVDFDETVTRRDSIARLLALASQARSAPQPHAVLVERLVARYAAESARSLAPLRLQEPPTGREFHGRGLARLLEGFATADRRSVRRVEAARALGGVETRAIRGEGRSIEVRDGCAALLRAADSVAVVSTNWSALMVSSALEAALGEAAGRVRVIANELRTDDNDVTTGEIDMRVQSPADKADEVRRIRDAHRDALLVFVGDGVNDLLALLEADVGIAIKSESKAPGEPSLLEQIAQRYGVSMEPIQRFNSVVECAETASLAKSRQSRIIFSASSWREIALLTDE